MQILRPYRPEHSGYRLVFVGTSACSAQRRTVVHPANPFSPESHRLLAFSRDLFQVPDDNSVLDLFHPIFFEFLGPRVALLSLKRKAGNMERHFDFEGEGQVQSLFKSLREHLSEDSNAQCHEGAVVLDVDLPNDDTRRGRRWRNIMALLV
jgi:hypothetical protein